MVEHEGWSSNGSLRKPNSVCVGAAAWRYSVELQHGALLTDPHLLHCTLGRRWYRRRKAHLNDVAGHRLAVCEGMERDALRDALRATEWLTKLAVSSVAGLLSGADECQGSIGTTATPA